MKRGTYRITCKNSEGLYQRTIWGYLFEMDGLEFGCSNRWIDDDGKVHQYDGWVVTELVTGYKIATAPKKRNVEECTRMHIGEIKDFIQTNYQVLSARNKTLPVKGGK